MRAQDHELDLPAAPAGFARRLARIAALALSVSPFVADGAMAREQTGVLRGACQLLGGAIAPWRMNFTRYGDVVVWTDQHGLNPSATDMGQWGPTYWEGVMDTPDGRYRLTGENTFIEAWLVGGHHGHMVTLEMTVTGPRSFTFRDFYNYGAPFPCRIDGN